MIQTLINGISEQEVRAWLTADCQETFCIQYARVYGDPTLTLEDIEQLQDAFEERYLILEEIICNTL